MGVIAPKHLMNEILNKFMMTFFNVKFYGYLRYKINPQPHIRISHYPRPLLQHLHALPSYSAEGIFRNSSNSSVNENKTIINLLQGNEISALICYVRKPSLKLLFLLYSRYVSKSFKSISAKQHNKVHNLLLSKFSSFHYELTSSHTPNAR